MYAVIAPYAPRDNEEVILKACGEG